MPRVEVKFEQDFRPIGKRDADIAIVYEQPHNAENNTFLKGSESRQLDSFLNKAGIDLYSCYRTTVAKKEMRGFSSRMYKKGYATDELQIHWRKLEKELKAVDPNVIITLGKEALRAVTQRTDISEHNYRGSILDSPAGKVIPTFDIGYIFKVWEDNPIMIFDLIRAKEESLSPELNLPERELLTDPTFSEIKNFINHCKEQEKLSFDIETIKGQSDEYKYIDCVGLAPSANLAMCVPLCKANGKNIWTIQEEMEIRYMLADLLADKNIMKIAQNAQFDISHLEDNGIPIENLYFDTMNAAKVIEPEFPKGLDFLVSVYTREPYYKDTSATERWIYNAKDAACTFEVHEGQLNDLAERGLIEFYFNHVHPLIRLFINVSRRGVKIDQQKFDKLDQELDKEVIKLQKELKELTEKDINVYSVTDMRQYIYDDLGMKPRYNDNDNLDTSSETLKEFDRKTQREEFQVMIDLRKARSRKSSFTGVSISDDGRVRTSYIVSGTESGRLSSKKYVDGTGMNLQNREKGIEREVFIPDKDMIFLGGDLGQAENRVVAYASGDSNMIDVVESEGDIHKQNAAMIFQKPVDTITPDERQLGKRITHGSNYKMGSILFAKIAGIETSVAKRLQRQYFDAYPMVEVWHKEIERTIRQTRQLTNPFGRIRTFHGRINNSTINTAVSFIPQSTVADCLHRATWEIYCRLPHPARIALQLHDEIFVQCLPEQEDQVKKIMKTALTRPFDINQYTISIPTDIEKGHNWNEVS